MMGDLPGSDSHIMRVRAKYGKMSCDDCRVSKHDFRALEKLTHCPSHKMGSQTEWAGIGGLLAVGGSRRYKNVDAFFKLVTNLNNLDVYVLEKVNAFCF